MTFSEEKPEYRAQQRGQCCVRFFCPLGEEHFCAFMMLTDHYTPHRHIQGGHHEGRQAGLVPTSQNPL